MCSKLVVIDDDPGIGELIIEIARMERIDVIYLNQAKDFIDNIHNEYTGIILDLYMPEIDGVEVIRHLGREHITTPIILMTGNDESILHSAFELSSEYNLNLVGTLSKPFNISLLKELLQQIKALHSSQSSPKINSRYEINLEAINRALEAGQIVPYFQPQVSIHDNRVVGAESLARWFTIDNRMIPPDSYINLIEQEPVLMWRFTQAMLEASLAACSQWKTLGYDINVSVNFSAITLDDRSLPEKLQQLAIDYQLDPSDLTIEITERSIAKDPTRFLEILIRLRMKGFNLSIDDFGTGFSSLQLLARAPFTELKIDKSFVSRIMNDNESRVICNLTTVMGHELNLKVVAEGVENDIILNELKNMGTDIEQGYRLAKPMSSIDFTNWLRER